MIMCLSGFLLIIVVSKFRSRSDNYIVRNKPLRGQNHVFIAVSDRSPSSLNFEGKAPTTHILVAHWRGSKLE